MIKIIDSFKNKSLVIFQKLLDKFKSLSFWKKVEEVNGEQNSLDNLISNSKTREEKILIEKRKRNQVYRTLDYLLELNTYYDYFSLDSFKITKYAKFLAQLTNQKAVTTDFFFLAFFYANCDISEFLKKSSLDHEKIAAVVFDSISKETTKGKSLSKVLLMNLNIFTKLNSYFFKKESIVYDLPYSFEVHKIFQKASQNAIKRFQTPIISPEILLITLMEEERTKANRLIKKFLPVEKDWLLFRYELLKRVYKKELGIKKTIPKNQHYFAYLMNLELSDYEIENLMENETKFRYGVGLFRNNLMKAALETDLFSLISDDTFLSMKSKRIKRKYSS
uniref:ClpN n=1 Tax=Synura sphagnicola TaxID=52556 RepID=A0A3G2QYL8_9STRA|nr:ClpN [Synura sphagnicola]